MPKLTRVWLINILNTRHLFARCFRSPHLEKIVPLHQRTKTYINMYMELINMRRRKWVLRFLARSHFTDVEWQMTRGDGGGGGDTMRPTQSALDTIVCIPPHSPLNTRKFQVNDTHGCTALPPGSKEHRWHGQWQEGDYTASFIFLTPFLGICS